MGGPGGGLEFGIGIPQVLSAPRVDVEGLGRFVARAEELGLASAWVLEQPIGIAPVLEPLILLAYAAAMTRRIGLGTAVILAPLRAPVALAKELATIDQLSGGRLIAGLALGGGRGHYAAFGLPSGRRVRRFEEAVALLQRMWTERTVTFEGEFWRLDGVSVEPKPIQQPRPPLWFGGDHPSAVRRAARMADGWIGAGSSSTERFAEAVGTLREALVAEGRDPSTFPVAKRVYTALDGDAERARSRLRRWFSLFYRDADVADRVAVFGPSDVCVAGLAAVAKAGAGLIVLNPVFDVEAQTELLVSEVVPKVLAEVQH